MAREFNVNSIDRDALQLGDTMAQSRFKLAQKKAELANRGADLHAQIEAEELVITSFEKVVAIIDRVADVTDENGERVSAAELPASVVEIIMGRMAETVEEMSDPNG